MTQASSFQSPSTVEALRLLDQGVLLFNNRPHDGLNFLIAQSIVPDTPSHIARFLATNPHLDRQKIGQFLAKDHPQSLAVLDAYSQLFDYGACSVDEALRIFLSAVVLAGESQGIYRVLERFAFYFTKLGSDSVDSERGEYSEYLYLAYAVVLLNVDLHSDKVKRKMTKPEFVRNTQRELVSPKLRAEKSLEAIYDRIAASPLKPATSQSAELYARLAKTPNFRASDAKSIEQLVNTGSVFLKYGRQGKPKNRKFVVTDGKLCWGEVEGPVGARGIFLVDIKELIVGNRGSENFRRFESVEKTERCFSLITDERSIDLQAPGGVDLDGWLQFFYGILSDNEKRWAQEGSGGASEQDEEDELLERWRDIVLNWPHHWNCGMRPGFVAQEDDEETYGKIFSRVSSFVLDRGQRLETAVSEDLVELWLRGLPQTVRVKLWPIAVGNAARINSNLLSALRNTGESPVVREELAAESTVSFITEISATTSASRVTTSAVESLASAAGDAVRLLLQLRPDLRFMEDAMVRLAVIVVGAVGSNDVGIRVYLNLMFSGYFLDFFSMRRGYMRMRFDLFEKIFQERLPHLYEHFSLLNITTGMYFRPWLLSGFSKVLTARSLLRVWDGFVLYGEAHFFTVALALLTLLEHSLMTQSFGGCIDTLTSKKVSDTRRLFKFIDSRPVSSGRVAAWLSTQLLAEEKQTLYDLLLV